MKKLLFILFILSSTTFFSQFKITGYFNSAIGVTYQFSNKLQTEIRINDNLGIEFNAELSLRYTITSKENYNINTGIGISTFPFHSKNIDFFESYFLPIQIEIRPFNGAKNFGFVLESSYHFSDIIDASGVINSIGVRYVFN